MLFGKRSTELTTADPTSGSDAGSAADPARRGSSPARPRGGGSSPARPGPVSGSKGRPTPTRREAEAANRRPLVVDRKSMTAEQKSKQRAERSRVREAMLRGEERYLPARDRGPERRFLRDSVDGRWNVGEILLPAMIAVLAISILPFGWARAGTFVVAYSLMLFGIIDCWLLWRRTKKRFTAEFGHEPGKGSTWYVILRAFQMRGSRIPRPNVPRGQAAVRR